MSDLSEFVVETAEEFGIPGVAVGVWAGGRELVACHGVTSLENPLPVDPDTMFVLGSVSKTYTATAVMCLVADGRVELDAPVRRYLPELRLADERAAAELTVRQLLNHTGGLGLGGIVESGFGDDALARYVAGLPELELIGAPGGRASYSQAGFNVLGRILEKITGRPFERAVAELLFGPLGLTRTAYLAQDVMTHRFAVGHNLEPDGTLSTAQLRKRERGDNPGGGLESSVSDQLRWARFHLGDGRAADGTRVLPAEVLAELKRPTTVLWASSLGDAIGLSWFLRDIDGVRAVGHNGSTNGQFADLLTVPERDFAVASLSNAAPNGIPFNQAVVRWALEHYLGLVDRDPEPVAYDPARAAELVGRYEVDAMTLDIIAGEGGLVLDCRIRPEIRAAAGQELPPDHAPAGVGLLPGDGDEYVVTGGGLKGQRGYFTRDEAGRVIGIDVAGRLFPRTTPAT
jgi:CubicO group peptidase (beta-lactamase class C family)